MSWLNKLGDSINLSKNERIVKDITDGNGWGPSAAQKNEVAELTHQSAALEDIMSMLGKRLNEPNHNYKSIIKALGLLQYIILNGSESVRGLTRKLEYRLKNLHKNFFYTDNQGREIGNNIRSVSLEILQLLSNNDAYQNQRKSARKKASVYKGFSKDEMRWKKDFKHDDSFFEDTGGDTPPVQTSSTSTKSRTKKTHKQEEESSSNFVIKKPGKRKKKTKKPPRSKRQGKGKVRRPSFGDEESAPAPKPKVQQAPRPQPVQQQAPGANLFDLFEPEKPVQQQKRQQPAPVQQQGFDTSTDWGFDSPVKAPAPQKSAVDDFFSMNQGTTEVLKPTNEQLFDAFDEDDAFGKEVKKEKGKDEDPTNLLNYLSGLGGKGEQKQEKETTPKKMTINQLRNMKGKKPAKSTIPQQAPMAFPPQGRMAYPPQAYPPQAYPPQGYPPQGYPPQQRYPPGQFPYPNQFANPNYRQNRM